MYLKSNKPSKLTKGVILTLNSSQLHINKLLKQSRMAIIAATVIEPKRPASPDVLSHVAEK